MIIAYFGEATYKGLPAPTYGVISNRVCKNYGLAQLVKLLFDDPNQVFDKRSEYIRGETTYIDLFAKELPK